MTLEGELAVDVVVDGGRVADVALRSSRRLPGAQMLRGKTCEEALRIVPLLFTTCGSAHALAAARAIEGALGRAVTCAAERSIVVLAEMLDAHAFAIAVTWAEGAPHVAALRRLRGATARLRAAVDPRGAAMRVGGAELEPARAGIESALADLEDEVRGLCPALPGDAAELVAWADLERGSAARIVKLALADAAFGTSDVPLLADLDAAWFEARLANDPDFGTAPTVDGEPRETGPLARRVADPLVASVVRAHGRGLLARVVARLVDMHAIPGEMRALLDAPPAAPTIARCAVTETSRGRLAHWFEVKDGRVADWRCAAPTEWNFHPRGAFVRGLLGTPASGLAEAARLHVNALDPCVPCRVSIAEAA